MAQEGDSIHLGSGRVLILSGTHNTYDLAAKTMAVGQSLRCPLCSFRLSLSLWLMLPLSLFVFCVSTALGAGFTIVSMIQRNEKITCWTLQRVGEGELTGEQRHALETVIGDGIQQTKGRARMLAQFNTECA
jgi:hypothetical protein